MELIVGMLCVTAVVLTKMFLAFVAEEAARKDYYDNQEIEVEIETEQEADDGDWWQRSPSSN